MKRDIFNHEENYKRWRKEVIDDKGNINPNYLEEGLTKENSKVYVQYFFNLEQGRNMPKNSPRGGRDLKTLNRLRSKILRIMKLLQEQGIKDITKSNEAQVTKFFSEWLRKGHSPDYSKRFKALWHWWMTVNRKKGKLILDITEDLETADRKEKNFVVLTKEEMENYRKYFDEDSQVIISFMFDSMIRAPTELLSLKVENIYKSNKGEVWVDIPDNIAKTFGRKFNLVYAGEMLLDYIDKKGLMPQEYLFDFQPGAFNKQLQKTAKQVFADKKSVGGDYYKNITLYDFRHSGAVHFRRLFQKTGQSLDSLRHRGGWTDFKMINYYTKLLGLDGHIDKEKTLLQEDKTQLQKKVEFLSQKLEEFGEFAPMLEQMQKAMKNKKKEKVFTIKG